MAISQTAAKPARTGTWPGTYFLSLTVENVRCFGPAQTLDLSDGHGRHAPWTVILGENGLGKTTLLTCLAYIAGVRLMFDRQSPRVDRGDVEAFNFHFSEWLQGQMGLPRADSDGKIESAVVSNEVEIRTGRIDMNLKTCSGRFEISDDMMERLHTFNYGASRRMPTVTIIHDRDRRVSIFLDDDVVLRDPEGWLY